MGDRRPAWLQIQTDAIELGKTSEDEQLAGSAQTTLEAQTQANAQELVQKTEDEQLPEITDDRGAGSVQSLELQTSRSPRAARAWSMLCNVLLLTALALFLSALFAWGP
jgi:hypothetical protein